LVALPHGAEAAVEDGGGAVQAAAVDQGDLLRAVAAALEERPGGSAAVEEARRLAAAVEGEGERVERRQRAGEQLRGPAPPQVVLAAGEQLTADPLAAEGRHDAEGAQDPAGVVHFPAAAAGAEAGVGEADGLAVGEGEEQSGGVEVRLGEREIFEQGSTAK